MLMLTATSVGISTDVAVIYFLKEDIWWKKELVKMLVTLEISRCSGVITSLETVFYEDNK